MMWLWRLLAVHSRHVQPSPAVHCLVLSSLLSIMSLYVLLRSCRHACVYTYNVPSGSTVECPSNVLTMSVLLRSSTCRRTSTVSAVHLNNGRKLSMLTPQLDSLVDALMSSAAVFDQRRMSNWLYTSYVCFADCVICVYASLAVCWRISCASQTVYLYRLIYQVTPYPNLFNTIFVIPPSFLAQCNKKQLLYINS